VLCAGSWTADLVPGLAPSLRATGQPVFHLRPAEPARFAGERFPVFCADIARTGWYGFPVNRDGVLKIANHGVGAAELTAAHDTALRDFLRDCLPELADAPIVHRRRCVYCDTADGHFWIAADPARPRLIVAAGGSGHAFKFAPLLGDLIADAVEGRPGPARFRWRPELAAHGDSEEAARHRR
jgi:glycine/D-amino acid oxidase-like deaminating enzyme